MKKKVFIIFILVILVLMFLVFMLYKNSNIVSKNAMSENNIEIAKDNLETVSEENANREEIVENIAENTETINNEVIEESFPVKNEVVNQIQKQTTISTNSKSIKQETNTSIPTQTKQKVETPKQTQTQKQESTQTITKEEKIQNKETKQEESIQKEEIKHEEKPVVPQEKYIRNDMMIAKIKSIIESNVTEDMKTYGYTIIVDSSIKERTNQFTFTENRVKSAICNKFGTIRIYAEDYYSGGQLIMTECYIF